MEASKGNNFDDQSSQLAHITDNFDDPFILFEKWINEAESKDDLGWLNVMNLATVNKEFGVLNRSVILLKFDQTGFVFVTERNSRKFTDMMENPKVAATLYWKYKLNDNIVLKQIRINGSVSEVSAEQIRQFYAEEELPGRIRCKICVCGKPCDWHELKKQHDEVLENVRNGTEKLEQNENYTALKIQPKSIDFYFSMPGSIADRILYTKDESGGWSHQHVCA
ncbi:pyridoxine/pyridoxamine 5'-phosphate oxidase [Bradysia coprophila]|uniref:pyridoxine/pyridoxamine 5'-phosphate oxidase n=1 Tax=Bradysia coprophila TaxID=38358 RepID=UPI00187D9438|nr:pyridoxine/pyridoxamine 5'-phosphate oxidase [Bradysia coprophila]